MKSLSSTPLSGSPSAAVSCVCCVAVSCSFDPCFRTAREGKDSVKGRESGNIREKALMGQDSSANMHTDAQVGASDVLRLGIAPGMNAKCQQHAPDLQSKI